MTAPAFSCDECEDPCRPAYPGASEPAHVTDGDRYWCDLCWEERWEREDREMREHGA